MLFQSNVDRTHTQLAYKLKYFPFSQVSPAGRELVKMRRNFTLTKEQFLAKLDDTHSVLFANGREWKVVWAHNNIPTEEEWNKIADRAVMLLELRASPAIDGFAVAIILNVSKPENNVIPLFESQSV